MQWVYLVATSFCMFVWKMWALEELCMNDANKISNSTFKATYTCSITLSYVIGRFSRNIFLYFRMQNWELVKNYARIIQTRSQNSTLKAIYTCSTILSYVICIFSCNIFLHVRMQNCELTKNYAWMIQTRYQNQYL